MGSPREAEGLVSVPAAAIAIQLLDREVAGSARRRNDAGKNRKGNQGGGDGLHDRSPKGLKACCLLLSKTGPSWLVTLK